MNDTTTTEHEELPTRRDFIYVATGMMGVVGVAAVAWPFIDQMQPDAAVRAAGQPIDVNVEAVEPGQVITVTWRGKPYFVRRLTETEIDAAAALGEGDMKDFAPVETRTGGMAEGATSGGQGAVGDDMQEWVIVGANCTHLGCIPTVVDTEPEGWFCPCHGSVFDTAGRILRGPAAENLPIPPYVFTSATNLVIGTDQA